MLCCCVEWACPTTKRGRSSVDLTQVSDPRRGQTAESKKPADYCKSLFQQHLRIFSRLVHPLPNTGARVRDQRAPWRNEMDNGSEVKLEVEAVGDAPGIVI